MKDILIFGASGHARVIIDVVEKERLYAVAGLVDETENRVETLLGYPVTKSICELYDQGVRSGLIAVGDNWQRRKLAATILQRYPDFEFVTAIHPSVNIGKSVLIGSGTVVMPGCSINSRAEIKSHCIVNTGANVDHDSIVEDFGSLAPGVTLGGNVRIGECTAVGLGSALIQKVNVGQHSIIGAGSVVVRSIPSHVIAYGNPCRIVRNRSEGEPYL